MLLVRPCDTPMSVSNSRHAHPRPRFRATPATRTGSEMATETMARLLTRSEAAKHQRISVDERTTSCAEVPGDPNGVNGKERPDTPSTSSTHGLKRKSAAQATCPIAPPPPIPDLTRRVATSAERSQAAPRLAKARRGRCCHLGKRRRVRPLSTDGASPWPPPWINSRTGHRRAVLENGIADDPPR